MAHLRASSTIRNSNVVRCKRVANQGSRPEIYHLFFVWVGASALCLREDGKGLWPISASPWPISGSLRPSWPFLRILDSALRERGLRPPEGLRAQSGRAAKENQRAKGKGEKPNVQKSLLKKQEFTVLPCRVAEPQMKVKTQNSKSGVQCGRATGWHRR